MSRGSVPHSHRVHGEGVGPQVVFVEGVGAHPTLASMGAMMRSVAKKECEGERRWTSRVKRRAGECACLLETDSGRAAVKGLGRHGGGLV